MSERITVLVDNESWIIPHAEQLVNKLNSMGYSTKLTREHKSVGNGWINFMLGCIKVMPEDILKKNKYNLVVHESNLPEGKGFAPMAWQILEGKKEIPVCLIEATKDVDAGKIWLKDVIKLNGTELSEEWRNIQGVKTIDLCMQFVKNHRNLEPIPQQGKATFYEKRTPIDSELDINISIKEQFDLLRIVNNQNYPAYFLHKGVKYYLNIKKVC